MRVADDLAMGRIESPPARTWQVHFRPGVQMASFAFKVAHLVTAGKSCSNALGPAAVDEQHRQIPACPVPAPQGEGRLLGFADVSMDLGEIREQLAVESIEKGQRIALRRQAQFGSKGGYRVIRFDPLEIGPGADVIMLVIDGQMNRFGSQDEIEDIGSQGLNLHGHGDIEMIGFLRKPNLGYTVSLKIEMLVPALWHGRDHDFMIDDPLGAVVAGMETQLLRTQANGTRVSIMGLMLDREAHV